MSRILYLGDPHVMVSNLEESDSLLAFVNNTANEQAVDLIVILGDLQHNFANVRVEVMEFWQGWLNILSEQRKVVVLVGNHDMSNSGDDSNKSHASSVFKLMDNKNLKIVDNPHSRGPFVFMPYFHSQETFIKKANEMAIMSPTGAKVLVCHQDIDGSQYENGFYAPNGVDTSKLNYNLIIGGHIHKRQRFGKVILPGTARWLNSSDSNEVKGLWLVDHGAEGQILNETFIDTSSVCTPILSIAWKEGEVQPEIPTGARVSIELIGTSAWITKVKGGLKGKASLSSTITDSKREERIAFKKDLIDYILNGFEFLPGVDKQAVAELVGAL